jgi:hypothetical protein
MSWLAAVLALPCTHVDRTRFFLIACTLGWAVRMVRRAEVQRLAVEAIRSARGGVCYDWRMKRREFVGDREPNSPGWLVRILGVD